MNANSRRKWLPAFVACLLIAGVFAPLAAFGQASSSSQQSQLAALISAAESSRSYASGTVDYAAANGLSVSADQAQLSQGDSLLAAAKTDLQSGTNLGAGIQAVEAAMSDYAAATVSSSVALGTAGLTGSVAYFAALSAVTEVNTTVSIVSSVEAQACGTAATNSSAEAFVQACAQVSTQVTSARSDLDQAAGLLVQSNGQTATSANVSQALSLVAQARTDAQTCQSLILTIASYDYYQRGRAYVSAVVDPLFAEANATVASEQSLIANLTGYQTSWTAYAQSQTSATTNVNSSASALGAAISQVNTGSASAGISAASKTAGDVGEDMSALLNVAGILSFSNLVSAVQACATATTSYSDALDAASTWSGTYEGTQLSAFSGYLSNGTSDAAAVQSNGTAYASDYQTVVADMAADLSLLPALQTIYDNLTSLPVSTTVSGANMVLSQETNAMGTVRTDVSSLSTAASSSGAAISVSSNLLAAASGVSTPTGSYLNFTIRSVLGQISAAASATGQAAQSFVASVQDCLQASVGTYASAAASLGPSSASLGAQTREAASAAATALTYVQSDSQVRSAAAAAGQTDITEAFQLFSSQNVSAGVALLAQASFEFQAASGDPA